MEFRGWSADAETLCFLQLKVRQDKYADKHVSLTDFCYFVGLQFAFFRAFLFINPNLNRCESSTESLAAFLFSTSQTVLNLSSHFLPSYVFQAPCQRNRDGGLRVCSAESYSARLCFLSLTVFAHSWDVLQSPPLSRSDVAMSPRRP